MKMRNTFTAMTALLLAFAGTAIAAGLPTWDAGNWYDMNEKYVVKTDLIGPDGFIQMETTSRYDVIGKEVIDQEKGSLRGVECWRIDFASDSFTGTGQVDISDPIPLAGEARFLSGSIEGSIWLSAADLSVVKKSRVIEADAEVEMGPTWFPVGPLTIRENEEYEPSLEDVKFPLEMGNSWSQTIVINVFGAYEHDLIGSSGFESTLNWTTSTTVPAMMDLSTAQGACSTYHINTTTGTGPDDTSLDTYYCGDAGWWLRQTTKNLPLGDGRIDEIDLQVTDYFCANCASVDPTPTPPGPTPTPVGPTPTPPAGDADALIRLNQTTYTQGDTMKVDLNIFNNAADVDISLYVVLEVAGAYYFYPALDENAAPVASFTLPSGTATDWFELWQLSFADPIGATIPVSWHSVMVDGSGNVVGNLNTASATLQ